MSLPSDDQIRARVALELEGADLDTLSEKALRKKLEVHFQCELKSKKDVVRAEVRACKKTLYAFSYLDTEGLVAPAVYADL